MFKLLATIGLPLSLFAGVYTSLPSFEGLEIKHHSLECESNTRTLGHTDESHTITVCSSNIKAQGAVEEDVIKHEVVHLIHYNLGYGEDETLLNDDQLAFLIQHTLTEREVLAVASNPNYSPYVRQELEARILAKLPKPIIMSMYWATQDNVTTSTSIN